MKKLAIALLCALTSTYALSANMLEKKLAGDAALQFLNLTNDCESELVTTPFLLNEEIEFDEDSGESYTSHQSYAVLVLAGNAYCRGGNYAGRYALVEVSAFTEPPSRSYSSPTPKFTVDSQNLFDEKYEHDKISTSAYSIKDVSYDEKRKLLSFHSYIEDKNDYINPTLKYKVTLDLKNEKIVKVQFIKKIHEDCFNEETTLHDEDYKALC